MLCLYRLRFALCALALASAGVAANEPEPASEAPAAPVERPPLPSRSAHMAADLARQLPPAEVLSLQAGEESFMALWRPANVTEPKGLVIILPGDGESADWPHGIGPLRRSLPNHGWHTLSLSLPDAGHAPATEPEPTASPSEDSQPPGEPEEAGYLPEETAAEPDDRIDEPDNEAEAVTENEAEADGDALALPERIDERIAAALEHARGLHAGTIVVLGQGTGAYWAARHLQQWAPDEVERLAMVQPRQPDGQQAPLAQLIPSLKLATGDFYYRESPSARSQARERLNASRRLAHPAYHQVGLSELTGDHPVRQEQLVRRIRGWLDKPLDQVGR